MKEELQGMNIEVGDYTIYSDKYSMWICKKTNIKTKNIEAVSEKRVTGYFSNLYDLAKDFIDSKTRSEGAKTLKKELKVIANARGDALKIVKKILEERL